MKRPSVSVCVPVYRGERHLADCLRSIVTQEGVDVEVVVSDDDSPDSSLQIAKRFASGNPGVKFILSRNSPRLGMVGNWNRCLEQCSGDFVKVVGQDDILFPGCLLHQCKALIENPDAALCATDCMILSEKGRKILSRKKGWSTGLVPSKNVINKCIQHAVNPLGEPVAILARREDYQHDGGFSTELRYFVDVEKNLRMLGDRPAFFIAEPLCGFRIHRGSASFSLQGDAYREFLQIERQFGSHVPPCKSPALRKFKAMADSLLRLAFYSIWG